MDMMAPPNEGESSAQSTQKNTKKDKKKTVVRVAGSTVWEDSTLLEWDPSKWFIKMTFRMWTH